MEEAHPEVLAVDTETAGQEPSTPPGKETAKLVGRNERDELVNLSNTILVRLRSNLHLLSPAESQIGEYILVHPRQVLRLPIDQLAREIGVSLGTLSKFCQTMGYSGFKEFKLDLAAELKSPFQLDHSSIVRGDSLEEIANKAISADVDALLATLKGLDKVALEKAIKTIQEAGRIDLFGFGISSVVALDAYHRFFNLGLRVNWLSDISLQTASSILLAPGDVALAFSYAGETEVTVKALKQARQNGATTIVMTANGYSPLAQQADIKLLVSPREPTTFRRNMHLSARTAMQGMVDIIYLGLLHSSEKSLEKLQQVSQAVDGLRS